MGSGERDAAQESAGQWVEAASTPLQQQLCSHMLQVLRVWRQRCWPRPGSCPWVRGGLLGYSGPS
jgi:hypothetical protein